VGQQIDNREESDVVRHAARGRDEMVGDEISRIFGTLVLGQRNRQPADRRRADAPKQKATD